MEKRTEMEVVQVPEKPPKQRVTMRDIAAECGVSLASVSGALNFSSRESIRDEVRLKIIRTATRMHYRPSPRSHRDEPLSVGIILNNKKQNLPGKELQYGDLAMALARVLRERDFLPVVAPTDDLAAVYGDAGLKKLDAWVMVDLDEEQFGRRLEGFYGPVLLLEAENDNALYCKVRPNYLAVYERANALLGDRATFLAMEDIQSRSLMEKITAPFAPASVFINRPSVSRPQASLPAFLERQKGKRGIVLGDLLSQQVGEMFRREDFAAVCRLQDAPLAGGLRCIRVENARCAEAAVDALCAMLDFGYTGNETNHILIDPK